MTTLRSCRPSRPTASTRSPNSSKTPSAPTPTYNNAAFTVTGSYPPFGYIRSLDVGDGRFYDWDDMREARRVAFLGSDAAKQLFPGRNPVGDTIYLNDFPYTVIGVMAKKKQDSSYDGWDVNKVFLPFSAMRRDFPDKPPGTDSTFDQLLVTPKSVAQHEDCKHEVRAVAGSHASLRSERTRKLVRSGIRCRKRKPSRP